MLHPPSLIYQLTQNHGHAMIYHGLNLATDVLNLSVCTKFTVQFGFNLFIAATKHYKMPKNSKLSRKCTQTHVVKCPMGIHLLLIKKPLIFHNG